ncbi:hypothetical protein HDV02_000451 [Globomyces sp. JEL0801]|nr:hypothetical protein HDV02_000451 [Globomyces sp. JEL0801]
MRNGQIPNLAEFFTKSGKHWLGFLNRYKEAIEHLSSAKAYCRNLMSLDEWYHQELPMLVKSRRTSNLGAHLKKDELVKLTEYVLKKTTFRFNILKLAALNEEGLIVRITSEAFACIDKPDPSKTDISNAFDLLMQLDGVGIKVSTILSVVSIDVPFIGEEIFRIVFDRKITQISQSRNKLRDYEKALGFLRDKSDALNKTSNAYFMCSSGTRIVWTPQKCQDVAWAYLIINMRDLAKFKYYNRSGSRKLKRNQEMEDNYQRIRKLAVLRNRQKKDELGLVTFNIQ